MFNLLLVQMINVFLLFLTFVVQANDPTKPTCPAKPIKVAYAELPPYYNKGVGIAVDVQKELEKRSQCAFKTVELPRARLWYQIEKGSIDMAAAGVSTPERESFAYFASYVRLKTMAVIQNKYAQKIKNAQDLIRDKNLQIGLIRGIKYGGSIDRILFEIRSKNSTRISEVTTPDQLFKLFQRNRFQVVFAEPLTYSRYLKDLNILNAKVLDVTSEDANLTVGLVLSKAMFNKAECAKWQSLIDSIKNDGTMKNILLKYVSSEDADFLLKFSN